MNYLISNDRVSIRALYGSDDYIAHALNLQWGKHKYIRRTGTPGNYVYTYAQDLRNAGRKLVSNARSTAPSTRDPMDRSKNSKMAWNFLFNQWRLT